MAAAALRFGYDARMACGAVKSFFDLDVMVALGVYSPACSIVAALATADGSSGPMAAGAVEIVAGMVAVTGFAGGMTRRARGIENHRGMTGAAVQ